jgi:hypothetical protein
MRSIPKAKASAESGGGGDYEEEIEYDLEA